MANTVLSITLLLSEYFKLRFTQLYFKTSEYSPQYSVCGPLPFPLTVRWHLKKYLSVPPTSNIHIRHCFCDSTGVFLLWQNIFFPNPSHEPRKNKSSEMAKVSFSRNYFWGNICRFLVFEFLQMTKFVISNVKINKIIRMQKTHLHSSRTDDYQHLWMHQHLHFTIYSIKRRKKMSKLQNILQKDSFIKFLLSSSATQGASQCVEIFSG